MSTTTNTPVAVGDKIIPLPENGDDWYGIPEFYRDKIGTVAIVYSDCVVAEFTSHQKPDDTVRWTVNRWRKRPKLGDTVRCIDPEWDAIHGNIGHVDIDDQTTLPFWVKGFYPDAPNRGVWMRPEQIEVVQDGETLTVSYVPAVGDYVRVTARLNAFGIEHGEWHGFVTEVEGTIWTVETDGGPAITGPGHVEAAEQPAASNEATDSVTDLQTRVLAQAGTIEELQRQLARANERVEEYGSRASKWERDFMRSWERIGREATERDWCSEYEQITDEVQETLEIGQIPARVKMVEKRVRIRGEVYRDVTVWVAEGEDATDPENWRESDDPDDTVSDEYVTDQIDSEYNNNGWDDTNISVLR